MNQPEKLDVILRPFDPDLDSGFIFGTFSKGVYYAAFPAISNSSYHSFSAPFHEYLTKLLTHARVFIACSKDNPTFLLGYSIIDNTVLHWVFVKPLYRKSGIGRFLVKNKSVKLINEDNLTKAGHAILENHNKEELF